MANSKISALTSATTPLAGTETLPIVQSSTTKQVSVANLTAGRTVSASSLAVGLASPTATLDVSKASNNTVSRTNAAAALGDLDSLGAGLLMQQTASSPYDFVLQAANAANSAQFPLKLNPSGGDVKFGANLIPSAAAKGINFTANTPASGSTSQLLNWYEEGTFTATAVPDTGSITLSTNTLRYTRIGRMVNISGYLVVGSVSSPTNNVYIATLPFVVGLLCGGGIAIDGTNAFTGDVGWYANGTQSVFYIYYRDITGAYAPSAPIFKAGTVIRISTTYTI